MNIEKYPQLILPDDFGEQGAFEASLKGHLSCAEVELENGMRYKLNFVDPVRLEQDLADEIRSGRPYIAEEALVVVPTVAIDLIRSILQSLQDEGFFERLKPR